MCESISDIGTWYCVAVVADGTVPLIRYKPYRPVGRCGKRRDVSIRIRTTASAWLVPS